MSLMKYPSAPVWRRLLISSATMDVAAFGTKQGIGRTGVHLRYHKSEDYKLLTKEQKDELREWRETDEGKEAMAKDKGKKGRKVHFDAKQKKAMAASVEKKVAAKLKAIEDEKSSSDEMKAYIMSLIKEVATEDTTTTANTSASTGQQVGTTPLLKSILKRAKNGQN